MTISYQSDNSVSLVSKGHTVRLGDNVLLDQYVVQGAGEYDVVGISCESKNLARAKCYFIRIEDLDVTFLSGVDGSVTQLDEASNTSILVLWVESDKKASDIKPILKGLEPAYLFLNGPGTTPELITELALPTQAGSLKVTSAGLPEEGTTLIFG